MRRTLELLEDQIQVGPPTTSTVLDLGDLKSPPPSKLLGFLLLFRVRVFRGSGRFHQSVSWLAVFIP